MIQVFANIRGGKDEATLTFDLSYAMHLYLASFLNPKKGEWIKKLLSETVLLSLPTVCNHKLLKTEGASLDRSSGGTAEIPHVTRAE